MDRLDFEELALKSIDPSMGPTITRSPSPPVEKPKESLRVCIGHLSLLTRF